MVQNVVAVVGDIDEELAGCAVWLVGFRHSYGTLYIAVVVAYLVWNCCDVAVAVFSSLYHKASNYAVKYCTIIEALLDEVYEIRRCDWLVVSHLDDYVTR